MRARDFEWQVVPPDPLASRHQPTMRIAWTPKSMPCIALSKAAMETLGLSHGGHINIVIAPGVLGIRSCGKGDPHAITFSGKGRISAARLLRNVLRMREGESFLLPTAVDDGYVIGELPPEIVERMKIRRVA